MYADDFNRIFFQIILDVQRYVTASDFLEILTHVLTESTTREIFVTLTADHAHIPHEASSGERNRKLHIKSWGKEPR